MNTSYRTVAVLQRHLRRAVSMSSYALLFPGQGSQYVGMTCKLQDLPGTRTIFRTAERVLGYDLQSLCLQGPREMLDQTVHCQPAVVVGSLVALQQLEAQSPEVLSGCTAAAGFSVGEITALIFAEALSLEQGLQLIKTRADCMQAACEEMSGSMLSVVGLETEVVQSLCDQANAATTPPPKVCIANYMFPRGLVVSGGSDGVRCVEEGAVREGGVVKQVAVSGAFHSSLMSSAVPKLTRLLETMDVTMPRLSVISNVTGRPYSSVEEIRQLLADQVTQPVLWEASLRGILDNGPLTFVEVGPNKQLKTILKRINRDAFKSCISVTV